MKIESTKIEQDGPDNVCKTYCSGVNDHWYAGYEFKITHQLNSLLPKHFSEVSDLQHSRFSQSFAGIVEDEILNNLSKLFPHDEVGAFLAMAMAKLTLFIKLVNINSILFDTHSKNFTYNLSNKASGGYVELDICKAIDCFYAIVPGVELDKPLLRIDTFGKNTHLAPEAAALIRQGIELALRNSCVPVDFDQILKDIDASKDSAEIKERKYQELFAYDFSQIIWNNLNITHPRPTPELTDSIYQYTLGVWINKVMSDCITIFDKNHNLRDDLKSIADKLCMTNPTTRYPSLDAVEKVLEDLINTHEIRLPKKSAIIVNATLNGKNMDPNAPRASRKGTLEPDATTVFDTSPITQNKQTLWPQKLRYFLKGSILAAGCLSCTGLYFTATNPLYIAAAANNDKFSESLRSFFEDPASSNLQATANALVEDTQGKYLRELRLHMAINNMTKPLQGKDGLLYRTKRGVILTSEQIAILDTIKAKMIVLNIAMTKANLKDDNLKEWLIVMDTP